MNKTPSSTVLILNLSYMDQLLKNSKLYMVLVTERDLTFESFYCRKQKLSHSRKQQVLSRVSSEPVRTCAGFFFFFCLAPAVGSSVGWEQGVPYADQPFASSYCRPCCSSPISLSNVSRVKYAFGEGEGWLDSFPFPPNVFPLFIKWE